MSKRRPSPEEVFHQARMIDVSGERDAYLRGACDDDLALRSKVEALLKADAEAGAFLASGCQQTDASDEAPPHEQVGAMIGRYKLLQEIGEGGFGVVYLAEQKQPVKRRVALKVIKLGMDTKQVIARFEAERQALAMMDHAHIAKVLDAGATDSGRPYFVMELVKGIAITEYCDKNNLTIEERLNLFSLVCSAVQHAHQKGIIHRDIKPSNVLVTLHDGVPVPKVIDFGIAKATSAELTEKTLFTEHGQMIGTPVYMSPEQAEMSGLDIDTRSDIYSLGVLLYELLTGTTPFTIQELREAGYAEMQRMICEHEPQKPSTRISTLDSLPSIASHRRIEPRKLSLLIRGDLDWIIMRALEKDRTRRYETASGLAADVGRFLGDEPVIASPPSIPYRVRKFVRRNRKGVIAGAVMAVVLVAATGFSTYFGLREGRQRRIAEGALAGEAEQRQAAVRSADRANQSNELLVAANDDLQKETERADRKSYSVFLHAAQAQLAAGNIGDAQRLHALCPQSFRNWEWHHLGLSLDQSLLTLEGHDSPAYAVDWSPDGTRIISGLADGSLRIWNAITGESLQLEGHEKYVHSVAWSPDGTRIVSGASDDNLCILWNATSGERLLTLEGHTGGVHSVAWSPDGTRIVSGGLSSADKTVRIWDAKSGACLRTLEGHGLVHMISVAWSPDGTRIVSGSRDKLNIWDAVRGEHLRTMHRPSFQVYSVAWSPNGTQIVSAGGDDTLRIWDVASGNNLRTIVWPERVMGSVSWSPDGTRIVAAGSDDETLRIWNAKSGRPLQTLTGHAGGVVSVAWSPDGKRIASGAEDRTVRIWDAASGDSVQTLEARGNWVADAAWNPSGTRISSLSSDSRVRIWDTTSGDGLRTLEDLESIAVWSPDWARILSCGYQDNTPRIRDAESGESLLTLEGHEGVVSSMAWSPDGTRIVAGSWDHTLRIWDAATGESLLPLVGHQHSVICVAWSPDGTRIVSGANHGILRIWDTTSGESLLTLDEHESPAVSVAWSPDGARVVSGSLDGTLRIWDAATGDRLLILAGHGEDVESVAWSPDGTRIVSGSSDKTLRIWDASTGESLMALEGHESDVNSVAWSPDGTRIVSSGGYDRTLRIWESRLEDALPLWRTADQRRPVRTLVNSLFDEHVFLEPVLSALHAERSLSADLLDVALRLARSRGDPTTTDLNSIAWDLVDPDREDEESDVTLGLNLARKAIKRAPEDDETRDTLAWALFANGLYSEALAESEKALELTSDQRKEEYQGYLDRLRERVAEVRSTDAPGENASTQDR